MFGLFVGLLIIFGFIEAWRLDESHSWYYPPAINQWTGKQTTKIQAWLGRMIGNGLWLLASYLIIAGIVSLF